MGKGRRSRAEGWAHTLCSKADHSNSRTVRAAGRHTQTWHCAQGGDGLCCRGLCTRDKLCKVSKPRSCPLPPISPLPVPHPQGRWRSACVTPHTTTLQDPHRSRSEAPSRKHCHDCSAESSGENGFLKLNQQKERTEYFCTDFVPMNIYKTLFNNTKLKN